MKNLIQASMIALTALSSSAALADIAEMTCEVSEPCAYSQSSDLGYCLKSSFTTRKDTVDGNWVDAAIIGKASTLQHPGFFRVAAAIPLNLRTDPGTRQQVIVGSIEGGESWIYLAPGVSPSGDVAYSGQLVLAQDFSFEVSCSPSQN